MSKYLDPKNDLVFKRIFGEHKHLCMSLLNSMLPFEKGQEIVDLEYQTGELFPELIGYRHSIVDVRCTDSFGRQFLVEMQIRYTKSFQDRVLYNVCKAYSQQLGVGQKYEKLNPVYALVFMDTNMYDGSEYYHRYRIKDEDDPTKIIEGLEFIFIELRKFKPSNIAEKKLQDLWLRFLTEVNEGVRNISEDLLSASPINEALGYAEQMGYTDKQLFTYNSLLDSVRTELMYIDDAWNEGIEKGKAEGIAEGIERGIERGIEKGKADGIAETQKNIAISLLKRGMSAKEINELTGLRVEDINKLKS